MNNVIVVPQKIKIGLYSIMVKEKGEELIAICSGCGTELTPSQMKIACESEWIFCSDSCLINWIKKNKPEEGY